MQNEESRRTVMAVEEAFHRYSEIYEQAPVDFVTIDRDGAIADVDQPAEPLLGVERRSTRGKKLAARDHRP
jgi:PAS domain S-box-containing protein